MAREIRFPHVHEALKYARAVVSGRIVACKWTKFACKRQLEDLKRWKKKKDPYHWEPEKGERVCKFIENLPHIKGEWANRRENLTLSPWQKFILTTVFGWIKPDGYRRFKTVYIEVPRKNGKTTFSAGVGLYMLAADGEAGAEIYSAAAKRDQAKIVFKDAWHMASSEPEFREYYGVEVNAHNINILGTASKFESVSSDGGTNDGLNTHNGIIDELHAHKNRSIFDVIETSMGARTQPILWIISTAGSDMAGICYEQREYVTKVLEKTTEDESYFGIIYTTDEGDDWKAVRSWKKANPNYGISVKPDYLKDKCAKAEEMPSARNTFLTKHLNNWVNADTAWMDLDAWAACYDPDMKLEDFEGEDCWGGLDLSSKKDLTSKAKIFKKDDEYYIFMNNYLPEDRVHSKDIAKSAHYDGWSKDGWITLTDGNMIDLDLVEEEIRHDLSRYSFKAIGYDPWQAAQMVGHLLNDNAPMVEIRPTVPNFSDPMKTFEALVLGKKIHHNGDPVLTWAISNVVCHVDRKDNIYPNKEREPNKIDPVIAVLTALNRALADNEEDSTSVYESRGILQI